MFICICGFDKITCLRDNCLSLNLKRLRQAMGQADEGRKTDVKLLDTKTELYNKINELKSLEIKHLEIDSVRRQLEQKNTQLELQVHNLEAQVRTKDVRINQLEQEALSTASEMNLLKVWGFFCALAMSPNSHFHSFDCNINRQLIFEINHEMFAVEYYK